MGSLVNGRLDSMANPLRASSHLRELRVKLSRLQISREGREEAKDREGSRINLGCLFSIVSPELPGTPEFLPRIPLTVIRNSQRVRSTPFCGFVALCEITQSNAVPFVSHEATKAQRCASTN